MSGSGATARTGLLAGVAALGLLAVGAAALVFNRATPPDGTTTPRPVACLPVARQGTALSPLARPLEPAVAEVRRQMEALVRAHSLDAGNPWAVGHGLLALGEDVQVSDGRSAVNALFEDYAERAGPGLVRFPRSRGNTRIEPHTELILKSLIDAGVAPERVVTVGGAPATVAELYCHARQRAEQRGEGTPYENWNDTPWGLTAVAAWTPPGSTWTGADGQVASLGPLTQALVAQLHADTRFLAEARAAQQPFQKRGQGIFAYTCGGAHFLQGAAAAVAWGHATPADRALVAEQGALLVYRYPIELLQVEQLLPKVPPQDWAVKLKLMVQRVKFIGHFLETVHQLAAWGLYEPTEAERQVIDQAPIHLARSFEALAQVKLLENLPQVRGADEQLYLDVVGDTAHALRGLDFAAGTRGVRR